MKTEAFNPSDLEKNHDLNLTQLLSSNSGSIPIVPDEALTIDSGNCLCQGETRKSFQYAFLECSGFQNCFLKISWEYFTEKQL